MFALLRLSPEMFDPSPCKYVATTFDADTLPEASTVSPLVVIVPPMSILPAPVIVLPLLILAPFASVTGCPKLN